MTTKTIQAETNDLKRYLYAFGLVATLLFSVFLATPSFSKEPNSKEFNLGIVKQQVLNDYKNVAHMQTEELQKLLADKKDVLIFDVREESEFNVSHIPGAIRISPSSWGWTFLRDYGDRARGKTIVFYCSVGVRSSIMAARVQEGLTERGAEKIRNLNGGIFAWHNENRSVVNANGQTQFVHPYDKHWGSLLTRKSDARMSLAN